MQNIPVLSPACPWLREKRQRYCQSQLCPGMVTCGLWEREGTVIEWAGSGHTHNTCPNPTLSSEMQVEDAPWGTRRLSSRHWQVSSAISAWAPTASLSCSPPCLHPHPPPAIDSSLQLRSSIQPPPSASLAAIPAGIPPGHQLPPWELLSLDLVPHLPAAWGHLSYSRALKGGI